MISKMYLYRGKDPKARRRNFGADGAANECEAGNDQKAGIDRN